MRRPPVCVFPQAVMIMVNPTTCGCWLHRNTIITPNKNLKIVMINTLTWLNHQRERLWMVMDRPKSVNIRHGKNKKSEY